MKIIEIIVENHPYSVNLPVELEECLALADQIPVSIAINNQNFVLVTEEDFESMMVEDFYENYTEDEDNKEEESDYQGEYDFQYTPEEHGDSVVSLVLGLLENHPLNSTQLCHLEEVVSAMGVIATAHDVYRGDN